MEFARKMLDRNDNLSAATLISYDLQAGAYIRDALSDPEVGGALVCTDSKFSEPYKRCVCYGVSAERALPWLEFGIFILIPQNRTRIRHQLVTL